MLRETFQFVRNGGSLSMAAMAKVMGHIMDGRADEDDVADLLVALHERGETVTEVAGAATAMRQRMTRIVSHHSDLIDTCGTGGDGAKTFNISTAAAIVAAAAGVPVAKHGNRSVTSRSGSADVLAALGVNIEADVSCVEDCLAELKLCFCFAPVLHAAMRHVAPVRKRLATPTIFNILGPLVNPAGAAFQLLGVGHKTLQPLLAEALGLLGVRRALVVHGEDGLDEVTLAGPTVVLEVVGNRLSTFHWRPADFGLAEAGYEEMLVTGPDQSAGIIRALLAGKQGPPRDIVTANAAAAIWTAGHAETTLQAAQKAAAAIDSGAARELLARLAERSHRRP